MRTRASSRRGVTSSSFPSRGMTHPRSPHRSRVEAGCEDITDVIPAEASKGYDVMAFIRGIIDDGSFFEIKRLFAREIVCGFARIDGHAVGILASQPRFKGGVLFVDSADKATRFITCCDAFNVPLLFLADVPGFMIGTAVERQGIIRHGAKMISALAQAQVPRISVILRKAYGAGLYAMSGPAFEPDCTLALPTAQIAVMGPEAAINAVYYNKIQDTPEGERAEFVKRLQDEYRDDIDIFRLASELIVDAVVPAAGLARRTGPPVCRVPVAAPRGCRRGTIPSLPSDWVRSNRVINAGLDGWLTEHRLPGGRALRRHREPRRPAPGGDDADHGGGVRCDDAQTLDRRRHRWPRSPAPSSGTTSGSPSAGTAGTRCSADSESTSASTRPS